LLSSREADQKRREDAIERLEEATSFVMAEKEKREVKKKEVERANLEMRTTIRLQAR
jgi:hypothetical protein